MVLAALAASGDGSDWAYKADDGPYAVKAVKQIVLRDDDRAKDLQLRVTWPDGDGPFPVIVWSHGATGTKDFYQPLIRHWASHGYAGIQPNHTDARSLTGRNSTGDRISSLWGFCFFSCSPDNCLFRGTI